ncbi:MAG: MFS transporter [Proteobacteria bacterium]|nr:MFS transporter [Pseudomonadota bacterium]
MGAIAAATFILPKDEHRDAVGLDWGGVALLTTGLFLLVVPLLEGRDLGWPLWMIACFVAAFPLFGLFVLYERRFGSRGGRPLVRMELFACRSFSAGVPIAALFMAAYAGYLFTLALYLQVGLGFSPLRSGLTYTPSSIGFFATSLLAPRLIPLLGRHVLTVGYVLAAFGLAAAATTVHAAGANLAGFDLAPSLLLVGMGLGFGMSPLVGTVITGLAPEEAGAGAGIVTTTLQVGMALGVALISLVFFARLGTGNSPVDYANALATSLPVSCALLLVAAYLVRRLPRTPFEASNALIERLPGWSSGFAYSMFLMTGGRLGDRLVQDMTARTADRRLRRTREAPLASGDFLAFNFRASETDGAWRHYLMREALVFGNRSVPHEAERRPIVEAQVKEVRDRQAMGLFPGDLDAAQLRLMSFALAGYPRLLPQVTRLTTGMTPEDPRFVAGWEALLREIGESLERVSQAKQAV